MAKLTPGMKQDWKHRPGNGGRPLKRTVRLIFVAMLFLILLGTLIWFLIPPRQQHTFFFAAKSIEYDLWATVPLVHTSVADTIAEKGNHDPRSFHLTALSLEENFPSIDLLASEASDGKTPGRHDACVFYIQAHTLRYDQDGVAHVVVATPTFLRNSLANWQQSGVLDLNVVLDWIETANCPMKLVLLDAGTIVTDGRIDLYENNFTAALETEMKARDDDSLFIITSHENGQKSLSLSLQRNSIFSQAVQEAFIGKDLIDMSSDDVLTLDELYHHICVRVKDHLGEGVIVQTPRLFQGGQGILTDGFPAIFICRYFRKTPSPEDEAKDALEKKEPVPPAPPKAAPADGKPDAASDGKPDGKKTTDEDPRWVTLHEVWQLRDQLAQPPAERGGMVWSPIDFAPQYFRRLDSYLIGYQFRLLFATGSVPEDKLTKMKASLETLLANMKNGQAIQSIPPLSDTPADNLIEAWNQFVGTPYEQAWSAELTTAGTTSRDAILGWNYCVYQVPEITRWYEYTGSNSTVSNYESLLKDIEEITVGMLEVPSSDESGEPLENFPYVGVVDRALANINSLRRLTNVEMTISPLDPQTKNQNFQMAEAIRLIGYLKTSLPSAADRLQMSQSLRSFSQQSVPPYSYIDSSTPFLMQLSQGELPRASAANMERLRSTYLQIAAAGEPPATDGNEAFVTLGNTVPANLSTNADYRDQVRYQVRVRTIDWRNMAQIVGEVPPLPFRFPVQEKIPRLTIQRGAENQPVTLYEIGKPVEVAFDLTATNFPPGQVTFEVAYDNNALEVSFDNGSFDPVKGTLNYTIDASGPLIIKGTVTALLDREANAVRRKIPDIRTAQREIVSLSIPTQYIPPGAEGSRVGKLDVTLPWAEVVELIVQQTGADQSGIFYGNRVQIPVFDNRPSEYRLGVMNRSRVPRSLNVSLYPAVRPAGSIMPTGRIFSSQYHRKPATGGANSQEAELAPWRVASFERPLVNLGKDFLPTGIATGIQAPPVDQIPPPATRLRGRIVNEAVDENQCQWLRFTGPPGPPGPDGKPGSPGKVLPTSLTNGLLVVIEDTEHKDADGNPVRWMRWVEWVPRNPSEYLDFQPAVYPADKLSRLEMMVQPITGSRAMPRATWDEQPLVGFCTLPHNLAKIPIRVEWDWQFDNVFEDSELIRRQSYGMLNSPDSTATLGAVLNLDSSKSPLRPLLIDIASSEKQPTLRRAFRKVMHLNTGKIDADASAGFQALRLDAYVPHVEDEQKPPLPVEVMASDWPANRLPIILPSNSKTVDWLMAISTDTNSFNGATEINPDMIQLGLLEAGNGFQSARLNFTETLYSNRSFAAELTTAQAEGPLVITSSLQDIVANGLSAATYETFIGDFVVEIYNGSKMVESLRVPVVIDKDPPTINIAPSPLAIAVNDGVKVTIPTEDKASGIKYLEFGEPGPGKTIADKPSILEPLVGNIVPNQSDIFLRVPQFILNIRPADLKWEEGTTHKLRVRAVNRADLKSDPLDLIIRVGPKLADPTDGNPQPLMVIRTQVVFVNGRATKDPQYKPSIKELPLQPTLAPDGFTWVFESTQLKPGTNYTLQTSGRQTSGGIKSTETTAQASPANQRSPIYKLQFN
ncbi:hypothetical protein AB1L30_07590 [Bremerella sp. JC817]|uniref:hypothetical protein n=1 Tax=Bremerella sp. JC817 TaxID=3231756 RepID=UPI00345ADF24